MSQLDDYMGYLRRIADGPFSYKSWDCPNRFNPDVSGCADCSGLVVGGARHSGYDMPDAGSFLLSIWCHEHGTGMSYEEARHTVGALCFIGINEGKGGVPGRDPGHVATVNEPGIVVEARNHRVGIVYGPFDGRGWSYFAWPFWIPRGVTPVPTSPTQEDEMPGLMTVSFNHSKFPRPTLALDTQNRKLLGYHHARISWQGHAPAEQNSGTTDPRGWGIPGLEPVIAIEKIRDTRTYTEFVVHGLQGGQYVGRLHG